MTHDWPTGSGEMATLVRSKDWSETPLGAIEGWPHSLRTLVDLLLAHPLPTILLWGPELIQIYNDGYRVIADGKHPAALGAPTRECWPEAWHINGPICERVLGRGESVSLEDALIPVERNARGVEDAYFNASYAPARDEAGRIAGVFITITETTRKVQAERHAHVLDTALSHINDFAYIFDRDGRFLYVNKPLLDLWGLSLDQAVGKNFFDLQYPEDLAATLQRQIQQVIDTKQGVVDETPYTSPTGVPGYYEYIFSPVLAADGSVEVVAGSTRVITARKELEVERERLLATLRNERARLAAIIAQAPAFICTLRGPEHVFELANDRYYELVGKRDIIGKPVREALPEAEGQGFLELLDRVYRTGETFTGSEIPVLVQRTRGDALDQRYLSFVYQALREADGSVSGVFVHGMDVTDLVAAREALRDSESGFRLIADAMPQIVWVTRPDGYHEYYNSRWYEYIGLDFEQSKGDQWANPLHPDDEARARRRWERSLRTGEPYEIEYRFRRYDGEYRWFLARALPVRSSEGTIVKWYGTCTDIHDQKEWMKQREHLLEIERAARAEAERAGRLKDEFLATLSHELRTPLNAILGWSHILAHGRMTDPEAVRKGMEVIARNAQAQAQLIEDLLDMSRIISGKVRLDVRRVDVLDVIDAAIGAVQHSADAKEIRLTKVVDPDCGAISGDPSRLQQVLWNLLSNAIKFTPKGGEVKLTAGRTDSQLEITVTDTGRGIKPEFLPHVFDRFRQADASITRQYGGLGLGLAIVKNLVELHGGRIRAQSPGEGQGATFAVSLPVTKAPAHEAAPIPASLVEHEALKGAKLLVVDDEPDARGLLDRVFTDCKAEVTTASTAAEALALLKAAPYDAIVSDIGMPHEDGYELMRKVRALPTEQTRKTPAVALTAFASAEDRQRALAAGYQVHVPKPVEPAELVGVVARLLGGAARGRTVSAPASGRVRSAGPPPAR